MRRTCCYIVIDNTDKNIATHDKMQTTAGSWALLGSKVPKDAHIVSRLRDAGAVIIGHTNMSEWAAIRSSEYSPGYSPRGGQCRNAFDLSKSPCMPGSLYEEGAWLTSALPSWVKFWLGRSSFRKYSTYILWCIIIARANLVTLRFLSRLAQKQIRLSSDLPTLTASWVSNLRLVLPRGPESSRLAETWIR